MRRSSLQLSFGFAFFLLAFACGSVAAGRLYAQESASVPSSELIDKAWKAHGDDNFEDTFKYTKQCLDLYSEAAQRQQSMLRKLPSLKEAQGYGALNDVATACFIQGESYRKQGKKQEAIAAFRVVLEKYCYGQAWDQRGWYWSIANVARKSILQLNPDEKLPAPCLGTEGETLVPKGPVTKIHLYDPGSEDFVDYAKYGEFRNVGTKDYKYLIKDQEGLSRAVGEGVYPNTSSVRWDPEFRKAQKERRLEGTHWDFVQSPDLEAAFLKWSLAPEPTGIRLFYTGLILERAGLIKQAIKCYYAIIVSFPGSYGWTYWHTPWYVGQAAIAKINFLLRRNPQLGYKLTGADIRIINGYDKEVANDIVVTNPGKFEKNGLLDTVVPKNHKMPPVVKRSGSGKVCVVQYEGGDWQLLVDGKPFTIKAVTYAATKVGQSPDNNTMGNWMLEDFNNNGKADGPYDAFVDANRNNVRDNDEPAVGDFTLMQQMGVNSIRLYHHPMPLNKQMLRDLYNNYGIRVIMGDFLGKYAIGSGAEWNPGTDYKNPDHQKNMLKSVMGMVNEYKDEPFVLMWLLGNENVYGYACNADKEPDAFFSFANEVAKQIKAVDPEHPVAISGGDVLFLDKFGKGSPDIDIFGTNAYRGDYGFGLIWRQVKEEAGKPVFFTEYGCPAHYEGKNSEEGEDAQSEYHRAAWEDIEMNAAFESGSGNSIGGVVFEWLDEWWKAYEPSMHDTHGLFYGPFPDGYMHEEWLGLCGQGDGKESPFLRQLRKAYYMYQKKWRQYGSK